MKKFHEKFFYHFYKTLFSVGLRIYYKKITVSGFEKLPLKRPIITASNHPTGLMDVFLASHHIKRQIKFTAAGALFKDKLQAAFLTSVGTIPVYRRKDSPGEQDKNIESFELCFQELESGGAIGFYPEGTSHPEPWINSIKTGTARVALQAEDRNNFELDLSIVPIGINSLYPGKFRGSVFVNIGDPIAVKDHQHAYRQDSVEAVQNLTADIQRGMQLCAFHIQNNSLIKIFEGLKTIGVDEIKLKDTKAKNNLEQIYLITKNLEAKVNNEEDYDSENGTTLKALNSICRDLSDLENQMTEFKITGHPLQGIKTGVQYIGLFLILISGIPIIIPAIVANMLPFILSKNVGSKLAGKDLSLIPAARLMMGTVIFLLFYLLLSIILSSFIGILKALILIVFFIIGGYLSLWYWEAFKEFGNIFRKMYLWFKNKDKIKDLIEKRNDFINRINDFLIVNN